MQLAFTTTGTWHRLIEVNKHQRVLPMALAYHPSHFGYLGMYGILY